MQLIIVGFHRSGTSLLTQLLHRGGLFVGDELLGAMPSNPYGHFEDMEVLNLHRAILERHGDDWQWDSAFPFYIGPDHWSRMRAFTRKRNLAHRNWGFKDPRACLFLGQWKYLLPDSRIVVVYRDPGECVRSMESRHAAAMIRGEKPVARHRRFFSEPDHGLRLWDTYNRAVVSFVRQHEEDCLVLPFTSLTESYPVMEAINKRFAGDLEVVPTDSVFDPEVTSRREAPQRVHDPEVRRRVEETWAALDELAERTGT